MKKIILTTITFFLSFGMASNSIAGSHINWSEVEKKAKELNIKLEASPTSSAVLRFNELYSQSQEVAGAFHLTC